MATDGELTPYLSVVREMVTDVLAEEGMPQATWPPQPIMVGQCSIEGQS